MCTRNFCWIKISPSPATFVLQKIGGINFSMWYRSQYPLCNHYTGHIISVIKLSPIRAGGKIGENFSPGDKISEYIVVRAHIDGWCIATDGSSVHRSEAILAPEVNVCSSGKQRHDALQVSIASTSYSQGSI